VVDEGGTKEKEGERKREIEASEGKTEHPGEPTARYARHGATIPAFPPSFPRFSLLFAHLPSFLFLSLSLFLFFTLIHLRRVGISFLPFHLRRSFLPLLCISISSFFRGASREAVGVISPAYVYIYSTPICLAYTYYYSVTSGYYTGGFFGDAITVPNSCPFRLRG